MSSWVVASWLVKPPNPNPRDIFDSMLCKVTALQPSDWGRLEEFHIFERLVLTKELQAPDELFEARFWYFAGAYYAEVGEWDRAYEAWYLCARKCPATANNAAARLQVQYRLGEAAYLIKQPVQGYYSYGEVITLLTGSAKKSFKFVEDGDSDAMLLDALFHRAYLSHRVHYPEQARRDLSVMLDIIEQWTAPVKTRQEPFFERVRNTLKLPVLDQLDSALDGIFANVDIFANRAIAGNGSGISDTSWRD